MNKNTLTTPIEMVLDPSARDFFVPSYLTYCCLTPNNKVKFHKAKLGKQKRTVTYSGRRFWVWETDSWRVLINGERGVCFELPEDANSDDALSAWHDYLSHMKLV